MTQADRKSDLDDLERAARQAPEASAPAFRLCLAYLKAKDPRAGALVGELLARFPTAADGWDQVGQALHGAGKRDAAAVCFARALQASPTAARAIRSGMALRELGRLSEAAASFDTAVELEPLSARGWFGRGLCGQDLGRLEEAAQSYRKAAALEPSMAEAEVNLGTVLQDLGALDEAKAAYARAMQIRPDTFGRIAQALSAAPTGELWLDLRRLRHDLGR